MVFNAKKMVYRFIYSLYIPILPMLLFLIITFNRDDNWLLTIGLIVVLIVLSTIQINIFGTTKRIEVNNNEILITKTDGVSRFLNNNEVELQKIELYKGAYRGYQIRDANKKINVWQGEFNKKKWKILKEEILNLKLRKNKKRILSIFKL